MLNQQNNQSNTFVDFRAIVIQGVSQEDHFAQIYQLRAEMVDQIYGDRQALMDFAERAHSSAQVVWQRQTEAIVKEVQDRATNDVRTEFHRLNDAYTSEMKAIKDEAQHHVVTARQATEQAQLERQGLSRTVADSQAEVQNLQTQLREENRLMVESQCEVGRHQASLEQSKTELQMLNAKSGQHEAEIRRLQGQLTDCNRQAQTAGADAVRHEAEIQRLSADAARNVAENQRLSADAARHEAENKRLSANVATLDREKVQAKQRCQTQEAELSTIRLQLESAQTQLNNAKHQVDVLRIEHSSQPEQRSQLITEQKRADHAHEKLSMAEGELAILKRDREQEREDWVKRVDAAYEDSQRQLDDYKAKVQLIASKGTTEEQDGQAQRVEVTALKLDNDSLREQIITLTAVAQRPPTELSLPTTQDLASSGVQAAAGAAPVPDHQTQEQIDELIRTASELQGRLQRRDGTIAQLRDELEQSEDARLVAERIAETEKQKKGSRVTFEGGGPGDEGGDEGYGDDDWRGDNGGGSPRGPGKGQKEKGASKTVRASELASGTGRDLGVRSRFAGLLSHTDRGSRGIGATPGVDTPDFWLGWFSGYFDDVSDSEDEGLSSIHSDDSDDVKEWKREEKKCLPKKKKQALTVREQWLRRYLPRRERSRCKAIHLMKNPCQANRRDWRTKMLIEIEVAADRNDHKAREWVLCADDTDNISFEDLARIPPGFDRLDRTFAKALRDCLSNESTVYRQIAQEEYQRSTVGAGQLGLSALQMLRLIYTSLQTSTSLHKQHTIKDINASHWLGDGPAMREYVFQMEDMFNEVGGYSEEAKREIVSEHMRCSRDPWIQSDLAHFDCQGDMAPPGRDYTYRFLVNSLYRRVERADQTIEKEKELVARKAHRQKYIDAAKKHTAEQEKREKEGRGPAAWAMAATDDENQAPRLSRAEKQKLHREKMAKQKVQWETGVAMPVLTDAQKLEAIAKKRKDKRAKRAESRRQGQLTSEGESDAMPAMDGSGGKGAFKGKGKGKGKEKGKEKGKKGGKGRDSETDQERENSQKVFDMYCNVVQKKIKHHKTGELVAPCMFFQIMKTCKKTADDSCDRSHNEQEFKVSKVERDACKVQMAKNQASRERKYGRGGGSQSEGDGPSRPIGTCKYYNKDPSKNKCKNGSACKFGHSQ